MEDVSLFESSATAHRARSHLARDCAVDLCVPQEREQRRAALFAVWLARPIGDVQLLTVAPGNHSARSLLTTGRKSSSINRSPLMPPSNS